MQFLIDMKDWWMLLYNGGLRQFAEFMDNTIPGLVFDLFNLSFDAQGNVVGNGKGVYKIVVDVLSYIKISNELTLANIDLFSLMFGVGILFILVISLVKWLPSLDDLS